MARKQKTQAAYNGELILDRVDFPVDQYGKTQALKRALKGLAGVQNEETAMMVMDTMRMGYEWFVARYAQNHKEALAQAERIAVKAEADAKFERETRARNAAASLVSAEKALAVAQHTAAELAAEAAGEVTDVDEDVADEVAE